MDKFRWSLETTERLINLKHSEESVRKFKFAQNNPRKTKECWDELALSFGNSITGKEIKTKYNQLLCLYRDVACKRKKSGGEAVFWKYWKVFDETFPRKEDDMLASNLEVIATDESYEVFLEDTVNNINKKKEESVTSLKNLKIKALEVYIKKNLKDEREPVNLIEIQEKINVLERKIDNTLELLKKLIEKDNK